MFAQTVWITAVGIYETDDGGNIIRIQCVQNGAYITLYETVTTERLLVARIFSPPLVNMT